MSKSDWEIGRLEKLEHEIAKLEEKIGEAESTLRDTTILAKSAFLLGFRAQVAKSSDARKVLDAWMFYFKREGLSIGALNSLEKFLTED